MKQKNKSLEIPQMISEYNEKVFNVTGVYGIAEPQLIDFPRFIITLLVLAIPTFFALILGGQGAAMVAFVVLMVPFGGYNISCSLGMTQGKPTANHIDKLSKLKMPYTHLVSKVIGEAVLGQCTVHLGSVGPYDSLQSCPVPRRLLKRLIRSSYEGSFEGHKVFYSKTFRPTINSMAPPDGPEFNMVFIPHVSSSEWRLLVMPDRWERYLGNAFNKLLCRKSRQGDSLLYLENQAFEEFFLTYTNDKETSESLLTPLLDTLLIFRQHLGEDCYLFATEEGVAFFWNAGNRLELTPRITDKTVTRESFTVYEKQLRSLVQESEPVVKAILQAIS